MLEELSGNKNGQKALLLQEEALEKHVKEPLLFDFWERLTGVRQMSLHAKSYSTHETGWHGKGRGDVVVVKENDTTLVFHEKGVWQPLQEQVITFTNTFRWTLDRSAVVISLEHLRLGPSAPVFLFHLAPTLGNLLASVDAHQCKEDTYLAQVVWDHHSICIHWRVVGPRKNEEVEYHYF